MPKVSVIIPVYNTEKYLRECLDSVVIQTLKDIEIICINDGSTDNSLEILSEYARKDNRITVINKKNEGVGKARNIGIQNSTAEFVCFMDPDDVYPSEDILQNLCSCAVANNVLIAGGEFSLFNNKAHLFKQTFPESQNGYLFKTNEIIDYQDYQFDYGYHRFIYNREFLISNNIEFPDLKRFQDPPFFIQAMYYAKEFYAIHKITYGYRYGHNNINWNSIKIRDLLKGICFDMKFAQEHSLDLLNEYSYIRLVEHFNKIKNHLDLLSLILIYRMKSYNTKMEIFIKTNNLELHKFILEKIFSVTNSVNKTHKVITILGIRINIKRRKKSV